jgi:hypothetical protein
MGPCLPVAFVSVPDGVLVCQRCYLTPGTERTDLREDEDRGVVPCCAADCELCGQPCYPEDHAWQDVGWPLRGVDLECMECEARA